MDPRSAAEFPRVTLILTAADVWRLLDPASCLAAVEQAFIAHAEGRAFGPATLGIHVSGGGFHVKAAGMAAPQARFAAKLNANFPGNGSHCGLPTIQGVVVLSDAENGFPLAVMDSASITALRTAAATALAARTLARRDARVATICGLGAQSRAQLRAIMLVRPLEQVFVFDLDPARSRTFAQEMSGELGIPVRETTDLAETARISDIIVTCTPARRHFLDRDMVRRGTFVAAVGADSEGKQEIAPTLMASAKVVCDVRAQCAEIGDLHHAVAAGAMTVNDVHADLAEILTGCRPGRENVEEITVFDSTGTALQDVAAAALVHGRALAEGVGARVCFGDV
ncbi:MAG: ornithine cyclodeaminase family protein [Alphaproteobacteria bacterium]|nr:ornithine cyclodeaminase family protein [Alphaproteobacteria bacterium]